MTVSGAVADKARALLAAVREHKRKVREHRQAARKSMQELSQLQAECRAKGIRLDVA